MTLAEVSHSENTADETQLDDYVDTLLYRMHLTKGARYQAARRHQRRAAASIWSVIALSMYVFSTSTVLAIYELSAYGHLEQNLIITNIVMSAFIIAFAVLEQGKKHDLKAMLFLRCAQGIQRLRDQLEFDRRTKALSHDEVAVAVKTYNDLVHDFAENHSETDFRTFRINIGKHKGERLYTIYHAIKFWFDCWSIMLFSIIIPPLVLLYLYIDAI